MRRRKLHFESVLEISFEELSGGGGAVEFESEVGQFLVFFGGIGGGGDDVLEVGFCGGLLDDVVEDPAVGGFAHVSFAGAVVEEESGMVAAASA